MIELRFTIPGKPVGKNDYNRFDKKRAHAFITREGREYQMRCRVWAKNAADAVPNWPTDPFSVDHVRVSIYKYNTKGDHGAGNELLFDALEFQKMRIKVYKEDVPWGIYGNDKCVSLGECPKPISDTGEPRIEIRIELLGLCGATEAHDRRKAWHEREERRRLRTRAKAKAARDLKKQKNRPPMKDEAPCPTLPLATAPA